MNKNPRAAYAHIQNWFNNCYALTYPIEETNKKYNIPFSSEKQHIAVKFNDKRSVHRLKRWREKEKCSVYIWLANECTFNIVLHSHEHHEFSRLL